MDRTACTEPHCLYKGGLNIYIYRHRSCELDVLTLCTPLYLCLSNGGDLLLKHAGRFMFMQSSPVTGAVVAQRGVEV